MKADSINRISIAFGVFGLAALAGAGFLYVRGRGAPEVAVSQPSFPEHAGEAAGHGADDGHGHQAAKEEGHGDGDDHGASEKSDLDRPVEEMWSAKCEHGILQYTCDECRYELGTVKLSSELVAGKGRPGVVYSTKAGTSTFSEALPLTGEVQLSEGKTIHVASPLAGVIRRTHITVGQRVAAGDVLFEIDSHEVAEAKAEYLKSTASLNLARKTAEREETLFAKKISAQAEVQEAEARRMEAEIQVANARSRLLRLGLSAGEVAELAGIRAELGGVVPIRAPRTGTVLEGHVNAGEYVEPGKDLFVLSDLSEVWVWANLREADLSALTRAGGKVAAEVEGPDGRKYRGAVDVVSGTVSEQTRTARARIVLPNPGGRLRPGMFVKVRLLLSSGRSVVAVPKVAVLADEGRPFVFVHKEKDYWIRRPVILGEKSGDLVEIKEGLKAGQTIIADGSFLLKSDVLRKKMGAGCAD